MGMTWENKGKYTRKTPDKWEIDHFIPCNNFKNLLNSSLEQKQCFNWTNLRPLWGDANRVKWDSYPTDKEITIQNENVESFLRTKFHPSEFI